jgi:hypothetical protein
MKFMIATLLLSSMSVFGNDDYSSETSFSCRSQDSKISVVANFHYDSTDEDADYTRKDNLTLTENGKKRIYNHGNNNAIAQVEVQSSEEVIGRQLIVTSYDNDSSKPVVLVILDSGENTYSSASAILTVAKDDKLGSSSKSVYLECAANHVIISK